MFDYSLVLMIYYYRMLLDTHGLRHGETVGESVYDGCTAFLKLCLLPYKTAGGLVSPC